MDARFRGHDGTGEHDSPEGMKGVDGQNGGRQDEVDRQDRAGGLNGGGRLNGVDEAERRWQDRTEVDRLNEVVG